MNLKIEYSQPWPRQREQCCTLHICSWTKSDIFVYLFIYFLFQRILPFRTFFSTAAGIKCCMVVVNEVHALHFSIVYIFE